MNVLNFNLIILISIPSSWHGSSTSYSCNCSHRYRSDLIPSFLSHWLERVSQIAREIRLQAASEIRYGCVDYTIEHIRIWLVHIWVKVIEGLQKKNKFLYCPKCCSCQLYNHWHEIKILYIYLVSTIIIEHRIPHDIKVHATQFLKSSKGSCYFKVNMAKPHKSLPSCCISKHVFVIWLFNSLKNLYNLRYVNFQSWLILYMTVPSCKIITYLQESTCSITNSFFMPFQKLFGFLQ